jgi:hypothetical protein
VVQVYNGRHVDISETIQTTSKIRGVMVRSEQTTKSLVKKVLCVLSEKYTTQKYEVNTEYSQINAKCENKKNLHI